MTRIWIRWHRRHGQILKSSRWVRSAGLTTDPGRWVPFYVCGRGHEREA